MNDTVNFKFLKRSTEFVNMTFIPIEQNIKQLF